MNHVNDLQIDILNAVEKYKEKLKPIQVIGGFIDLAVSLAFHSAPNEIQGTAYILEAVATAIKDNNQIQD